MSRENIQSIDPIKGGVAVTFACHGGENRTYAYYGADAIAILAGAEPAQFSGERDGGSGGSSAIGDAIADGIADAAIDAGLL